MSENVHSPELAWAATTRPRLFRSFFAAGFECSTHRRRDRRRLDLIEATRHDVLVEQDYAALPRLGLRTARDGLRWHLIERRPGVYDWSSFLPMLQAAHSYGVQVVWDLCHYGYPDGLDFWSGAFIERFSRFARAAARLVLEETGESGLFCPVNEISYWAWAGGTSGRINPCSRRRGPALKRHLVRTSIAGIEAIREADPRARILHAEPLIHITTLSNQPHHRAQAKLRSDAQFEAWDLLTGALEPELGGRRDYLEVAGLNYYPINQWLVRGGTLPLGHQHYRPMRELLLDVYRRYQRPIYISETGAERTARAPWLYYVCAEVRAAMSQGVPIEGICLYPVVDYPGWDDGRLCEVGLYSSADESGRRTVDLALADELKRQQALLAAGSALSDFPASIEAAS
ncbi:MAG: beta-glucosidase [Geminicoccaceae bacterium]